MHISLNVYRVSRYSTLYSTVPDKISICSYGEQAGRLHTTELEQIPGTVRHHSAWTGEVKISE